MLMAILLVGSLAFPVGSASASNHNASAYAGSHVEFETTSNAIVNYSVGGETVIESMAAQSQSQAVANGDVTAGISLGLVTQLSGSAVSVASTSEANASATVTAESGATMRAHDSSKGILVVNSSGSESQYVLVNVSSDAEAESESDGHVVVTNDNGAKASFIAVGDANVTVNDAGNVSADVGAEGKLIVRSYSESDARDDDAESQEKMIANGTAAAEVYVQESADASGEFVAGVANYSQDTAVEVTQKSEGEVKMTAERTESEGRVVITSVSEAVIDSTEDLEVMVDGEAAAEASSYSELRSATEGGDSSKFLVRQSSSAEASADVLVALNEFSERDVTMTEGSSDGTDNNGDDTDTDDNNGDGTDTDGTDEPSQGLSGFGVGVALLALLAAAVIAIRNR
jgi:PGF-CTERM protein